jgi:hypothetical protein
VAPIRVTGVGGAYIASAEDTAGAAVNAASPAVRDAYSTSWFDYDATAGISTPGEFASTDFDNLGDSGPPHARAGNFVALNFGAQVQFGGLGVSATSDLQRFTLSTPTPGTPGFTLQAGRWRALAAYGMFSGQLAVGGGARVVTAQVQQSGAGTLLTMTGFAPEAGALLMPTGQQWRVGATVRAPVSAGVDVLGLSITNDIGRAGNFILPNRFLLPWEIEAGVAYQLGPRPLNPGWQNPHEQEGWLRRSIAADRARRERENAAAIAQATPDRKPAVAAELAAEEKSLRAIEDQRLDAEIDRLKMTRRARYANWPRE